jgi:hypothetical protein
MGLLLIRVIEEWIWDIGGVTTDKEKAKNSKNNPSGSHVVRHKFRIGCPGTDSSARGAKRAINRLSHDTATGTGTGTHLPGYSVQ